MVLCAAPQRLAVPPLRSRDVLNMALVVPLQGPAGIFGPSCESCATLAMEEINAEGGVLGRELNLMSVDGGAPPVTVARNVDALIKAGAVEAVTGWHTSAVREAVAPVIGGRVPYVLGAAPIEGRLSGVVDIPNSCSTVYIPTTIFDIDVRPSANGPQQIDPGSGVPVSRA